MGKVVQGKQTRNKKANEVSETEWVLPGLSFPGVSQDF